MSSCPLDQYLMFVIELLSSQEAVDYFNTDDINSCSLLDDTNQLYRFNCLLFGIDFDGITSDFRHTTSSEKPV